MKHKQRVLSYQELKKKILDIPNPGHKQLFAALYGTAAREIELLGLRPKDICYKTFDNKGERLLLELPTAKNPHIDERTIPINPAKEPWLEELIVSAWSNARERGNPRLFMEPIKTESYARKIRRLSWQYFGFHPHFLRHSRLTHWVKVFKLPPPQLQMLAGWTDLRPAKVYIHMYLEDVLEYI